MLERLLARHAAIEPTERVGEAAARRRERREAERGEDAGRPDVPGIGDHERRAVEIAKLLADVHRRLPRAAGGWRLSSRTGANRARTSPAAPVGATADSRLRADQRELRRLERAFFRADRRVRARDQHVDRRHHEQREDASR